MRQISHDPTSRTCPSSTVRPDANGWVPPGTCGYLARPYYPSLVAALVFCIIATVLMVGFARITILISRRQSHDSKSTHGRILFVPLAGLSLSTLLLVAYVLRAFGTRYQQVSDFVALSDTLVLMSPIFIFAFDCSILVMIIKTIFANGILWGLAGQFFERSLAVAVTLLSVEQLVASVLIAPKHRQSFSNDTSNHAMLGVKLYLGGIGVQLFVMVGTLFLTVSVREKIDKQVITNYRAASSLTILAFSLVSLLARTTYRLVELSSFSTGYLLFLAHSEVYFYSLECSPVLIALGVWLFVGTDIPASNRLSDDNYTYHELRVERGDSD